MKTLGYVLIGLGCLTGLYFFLFYNIGIDTGYGRRVVNEGLMNDRIVGMMFGMGMCLVGGFFATRPAPGSPAATSLNAPVAPPKPQPKPPNGFTGDIGDALSYKTNQTIQPTQSKIIYKRDIEAAFNAAGRTVLPYQIDYGYSLQLTAKQLAEHIDYIEAYRTWRFTP